MFHKNVLVIGEIAVKILTNTNEQSSKKIRRFFIPLPELVEGEGASRC